VTVVTADSLHRLAIILLDGSEIDVALIESRKDKPAGEKAAETVPKSDLGKAADGEKQIVAPELTTLHPFGADGLAEPVGPARATLFRDATNSTTDRRGNSTRPMFQSPVGNYRRSAGLKSARGHRCCLAQRKKSRAGDHRLSFAYRDLWRREQSRPTILAKVRISDFLDPSKSAIYRQLAGGIMAANILQGSANPISGQNCVIKLRWGDPMEAITMPDAPPGIVFALGENVKQTGGGRSSGRYPGLRTGVERILRDHLMVAWLNDDRHERAPSGLCLSWDSGEPTTRDDKKRIGGRSVDVGSHHRSLFQN